jgi:hypothetical protein
MPVSTTASALAPYSEETERNSTSTAGRQEFTSGPSSRTTRTWPLLLASFMWKPPGASSTCPGTTRSPVAASFTRRPLMSFSRSANSAVNSGGMCWTITTGTGKSAGSEPMTAVSASGPPVDAPIARIVTAPGNRPGTGLGTAGTSPAPAGTRAGSAVTGRPRAAGGCAGTTGRGRTAGAPAVVGPSGGRRTRGARRTSALTFGTSWCWNSAMAWAAPTIWVGLVT